MASTMSVLSPTSALKLLRSHDDAVEFEEQDGHTLDVESATIDEIIDCFWRKLLVLVLISARYPLMPNDPRYNAKRNRLLVIQDLNP